MPDPASGPKRNARATRPSSKQPAAPAGYSKRSLADKLGLKGGQRACFVALPNDVRRAIGALPEGIEFARTPRGAFDYLHAFVTTRKELARTIAKLEALLVADGMLWISWPKRTSGLACDFTETDVRAIALERGLVDVKVCAVTEIWSGLKLVIPVKDRSRRA